MKTLFLSLLILGLAVWFGVTLHNNSGYVLIAFSQWTVEMPLWFFVVSLLLLVGGSYLLLRTIIGLVRAPYRLKNFYRRTRMHRAREKMRTGFIALAEGRWKDAERLLSSTASTLPHSLLSFLGAAIAAQQVGALERRDNYLRLAHGSTKNADVAVSLTQARLQIEQGQLEQGLATLQLLRQLSPKHDYVLTLLKDVYASLGEWNALLELVGNMQSRKIISEAEAEKLQALAYSMLLKNASAQSFMALESTWGNIDKRLKNNTELVSAYVDLLLEHQRSDIAEEILREYFKKHWDEKLVRLYGLIMGRDLIKQLATAETWLKAHPTDPVLLLTLGRLSLRNQLWGKGRQYLQKSAELAPNVETYLALAALALRFPEEKLDYVLYVQKALALAEGME